MDSMSYKELENPEIINAKRIQRVAKGSGTSEVQVRQLLREYRAMKENLKMMKGNRGFKKLLKNQIKSGNFGLDESMFNS
jgi:signal recognition particle subunit SRP54